MRGKEVVIGKGNKPVPQLVLLDKPKRPRKPDSDKEQVKYVAPDFDATPEGFEGYV